MIDFGFEDAFMHIFKERRSWVKFGIIFSINFAFIVFSLLTDYFASSTTNGDYSIKTITSVNYTSSLIVAIMSVFISILFVIFSTWYTYENTQAGIQKRSTKLMWEYTIVNTFKKVVKYIVVSLVYAFFAALLLLIFIGLPMAILFLLVTSATINGSPREMSATIVLIGLFVCGIAFIATVIIGFSFYVITIPAYLRLMATDSFSEAFKIKSNFRITKKYFLNFLLMFILIVIFAVLFGFISGIAGAFAGFVTILHPIMGIFASILIQVPLTAISVYFTYYVYTRLLGNMYRGIINIEEDLKFLRK